MAKQNKETTEERKIVSVGSLITSIVHPREVFKPEILSNSASIILFHNHPSRDPESSKEDISIAKYFMVNYNKYI